jgi:hypothetical protein
MSSLVFNYRAFLPDSPTLSEIWRAPSSAQALTLLHALSTSCKEEVQKEFEHNCALAGVSSSVSQLSLSLFHLRSAAHEVARRVFKALPPEERAFVGIFTNQYTGQPTSQYLQGVLHAEREENAELLLRSLSLYARHKTALQCLRTWTGIVTKTHPSLQARCATVLDRACHFLTHPDSPFTLENLDLPSLPAIFGHPPFAAAVANQQGLEGFAALYGELRALADASPVIGFPVLTCDAQRNEQLCGWLRHLLCAIKNSDAAVGAACAEKTLHCLEKLSRKANTTRHHRFFEIIQGISNAEEAIFSLFQWDVHANLLSMLTDDMLTLQQLTCMLLRGVRGLYLLGCAIQQPVICAPEKERTATLLSYLVRLHEALGISIDTQEMRHLPLAHATEKELSAVFQQVAGELNDMEAVVAFLSDSPLWRQALRRYYPQEEYAIITSGGSYAALSQEERDEGFRQLTWHALKDLESV